MRETTFVHIITSTITISGVVEKFALLNEVSRYSRMF